MTDDNVITSISEQALRHFAQTHSAGATAALDDLLRSSRHLKAVTAGSIFEGRIFGDENYLIDGDALELGMHCFNEIYDVALSDDNGEVCFEMPSHQRFVHPDTMVLVVRPEVSEPRRKLGRVFTPPKTITLDDRVTLEDGGLPHHDRGIVHIVHARELPQQWLLVWRRDLRMRVDLPVLSAHSSRRYAIARAQEAMEAFSPPKDYRRYASRPDRQRGKVYTWESMSLSAGEYEANFFEDISQCQEYANSVYYDLEIDARIPELSLAHPNSNSSSYFSSTGNISIHPYDMERWTVLHEIAHHLVDVLGTREPGHGPTFVGVLSGLLVTHAGMDADILVEQAAEAGIDLSAAAMDYILERGANMEPTQEIAYCT